MAEGTWPQQPCGAVGKGRRRRRGNWGRAEQPVMCSAQVTAPWASVSSPARWHTTQMLLRHPQALADCGNQGPLSIGSTGAPLTPLTMSSLPFLFSALDSATEVSTLAAKEQ